MMNEVFIHSRIKLHKNLLKRKLKTVLKMTSSAEQNRQKIRNTERGNLDFQKNK